ncbi:uncharacterized protein isoform X2 [Rhodnius prolixus]|uniref:uncharacterized protein isoform X2 n=1 Tax=Rhodnius prolixus TaxID=13249 RepID=UPI003D18A01B
MPLPDQMDLVAQQYCLRWKYHHSNLQVMFAQLLERESFCDVTLACEGKTLRAHKMMLSACSTYFDSIFSKHEEKDPIVILKDVKFEDIKALVEFMYKGEINVENSQLSTLLQTAEELRIKGLAAVSWRSTESHHQGTPKTLEHDVMSLNKGGSVGRAQMVQQKVSPTTPQPVVSPPQTALNPQYSTTDTSAAVAARKRKGKSDYSDIYNPAKMPCLPNQHSQPASDDFVSESADEDSQEGMWDTRSHEEAYSEPEDVKPIINNNANNAGLPTVIEGENSIKSEPPSDRQELVDVIKMTAYIQQGGRRPHFWETSSTKRVMEAIKNKEIEMKVAAELLGVSYGTLYGRYRDAYGCLKHPYRVREFWHEPPSVEVITKLQRKELSLFKAAEMLNVTVTTLANYLAALNKEDIDDVVEDDSDSVDRAQHALSNNPDITIVKKEKPDDPPSSSSLNGNK